MKGFVYLLTNTNNTVLYTGVTSDLKDRLKKHIEKRYRNSFTAKYNVNKLVWFEQCDSMSEAIAREKQIKAGPRRKKIELIKGSNPEWADISGRVPG